MTERKYCPQCGMIIAETIQRYCDNCGSVLPLPDELAVLSLREEEESDYFAGSHQEQKENGALFCVRCGKKL